VDRATVPAAQVRASASAAVGAWVALAAPVAGLGVVALEDLVRAVAAVPAYGNPVVRPAVAEVAGRAAPAAVEAGALVAGPDRVAGLELVVAGALAVGQEPVAGLEPAVEAAQVGVAAQVEVLAVEVEAEVLVVGLDRVAGLELVEAEALAVGQEPVAGLEPAVEAAQVGVVAQVEVLVAEAGPEDLAVAGVQVEEAELVEAAAEGALAGRRVPRPGNG